MTTTNSIYSLKHQRAVIDHLVATCPNQRGLVVAHQMGGGKTLTALMFLRNYRRSQHIIVCPPFLKDLYDNESIKVFGKPLKEGTIVLNYDEFVEAILQGTLDIQNAIVVMDEAHYLIPYMRDQKTWSIYGSISTKPKKLLLLTGTPIDSSIDDLQLMINLAAGREVVPFRQVEFIDKYTDPNTKRVVLFGYLNNVLTYSPPVTQSVIMGAYALVATVKNWKFGAAAIFANYIGLPLGIGLLKVLQLVWTRNPMFYRVYNTKKLTKAMGPYVSFFKLKEGDLGIPTASHRYVPVYYSMYQTALWTRMVYNLLSDDDVFNLGITNSVLDANRGMKAHVNMKLYEDTGRMISNIEDFGKVPPKFEQCFKNMKKHPTTGLPDHVVVFSDFAKGCQNFEQFLQKKRAKDLPLLRYAVLTPSSTSAEKQRAFQEFKNGEAHVLLFYGMYEGISIHRASQMHLLDTPRSFKSLSQVVGRVSRIHSHEGLPKSKMKVEYIHYIATFSPADVDGAERSFGAVEQTGIAAAKLMEARKLFQQSGAAKVMLFIGYNPSILETLTPECLAHQDNKPLQDLMDQLHHLENVQVELPKMQCCPLYDIDSTTAECIARHQLPACPDD